MNKTYFVVGCGQSGEKYNEVQSKICRLQPIDGILNMLLLLDTPYDYVKALESGR
ncbi:MAG: hypothetical protein GY705_26855 [Bacteroidetes bacterium]|nr:hypothetical protein [Bacteroidota bacterium]